ncbi:ABC transporter ATP-binding protein [Streptomyces alkaliterrae]|uniref:ABC transporter ATP-binding protein n=1 Tax=Streptomyces alkaliterrae TaxID=2213162 RepID=A0A5P0YLM4_9ACTN|nr:ABC transporter ATP-binding protein [Streptomyces alkaliterrae]MBB1257809.1 ABC transporter ATP-binding protein [Streptomyces alkaliterrae]MQS01196.1 ATP-binding cassette domain-containing protein [Streptomyces alkaliterrae]
MTGRPPLLSVADLRVAFPDGPTGRDVVHAVRDVSFDVSEGEVLALVGESGAGKSLIARVLLGMAPPTARTSGRVRFRGRELLGAARSGYAGLWGRHLALVPQDALSVLSPVHTVGDQLAAAVRSVRRVGRAEARAAAVAALDRVGIADAARRAGAYPHEFSGGMRQRAVIAMATINEPDLVVADEPTTALDPDVREQVLGLLAALRETTGAGLLLVTHDLDVVARHADRVLVLYAGEVVEYGPVKRVLERPRAPYTAGLLASLPPGEPTGSRLLPAIDGSPPSLREAASAPGCVFAPRCPLAADPCRTRRPAPVEAAAGHLVSCHRRADVPEVPTQLFGAGEAG